MKFLTGVAAGAVLGAVLTYGFMPFPRVVWDGQNGTIVNGTFDCIGIGARHGAMVTVDGILIVKNSLPFPWCQGFLRSDFYSPNIIASYDSKVAEPR